MKDRLVILTIFALAIFFLPKAAGLLSAGAVGENFSGAQVSFPQEIRIYGEETGEITAVSAEEYLTGCLCAQIPINYEPEALKAQASASATYALRLMSELRESGSIPDGADISDSPRLCQPYYSPEKRREVYGDELERYGERLAAAARYGISHIMTYEGKPIYAVYHSVSAGNTCPSEYIWGASFDYLTRRESAADRDYLYFECVNEIRSEDARNALMNYDSDIESPVDCAKWFTDMVTNEDGYVISVNIGKNTFSGGDIWRIFGLRSTSFTVSYQSGIFTFVTKGYGHGAGLSQYGANDMALSGSTAEEILRHYYGESVFLG